MWTTASTVRTVSYIATAGLPAALRRVRVALGGSAAASTGGRTSGTRRDGQVYDLGKRCCEHCWLATFYDSHSRSNTTTLKRLTMCDLIDPCRWRWAHDLGIQKCLYFIVFLDADLRLRLDCCRMPREWYQSLRCCTENATLTLLLFWDWTCL